MGLRINNNVEAMDTLKNLTSAQNAFSLSMQRLSSGKRINSAADDAAGYAISNKLQAQSSGLNQAQANAQDGISMIQTATGGLQTTQNLLQRLRQLAVQSANDTNTTSDRAALQAEADQITQEITQIANTTQFNTKNLLDGAQSVSTYYTSGALAAVAGTVSGLGSNTTATVTAAAGTGVAAAPGLANGTYAANITSLTGDANHADAGSIVLNGQQYDLTVAAAPAAGAVAGVYTYTLSDAAAQAAYGLSLVVTGAVTGGVGTNPTAGGTVGFTVAGSASTLPAGGVTLQVGANSNQSLNVGVSAMDAYSLGVSSSVAGNAAAVYNNGALSSAAETTGALDITTQGNANTAITKIDTAIQLVSAQAASLGAVQNRLTAAISNLSIGSENMTAAYSAISNVNMAQESTNLATAQILQQSSTAMLAQANQAPQGVLKLLG